MQVVIIGNGIAGSAAAFSIRKYGADCRVMIISQENCPEYDPGALPYYLGGNVPRQTVFLKQLDDYRRAGIELILGRKALAINQEKREVLLAGGEIISYDRLVMATGGNQVVPPIRGLDRGGVFNCKILADADSLAAYGGKAAVVIGSGLIGIEAAEALKNKGYEVSLIELLDWILPRVFDREAATILAEELVARGIKVFTGEKVLSINGNGWVTGVTTDKREIPCDTVVLATGVVPASKLAAEAGIEVGKSRGIKVNEYLQTSGEGVYACGDCVETRDAFTGEQALYQLRHNALEQAEVVARNCMGLKSPYRGAWNFTRAHFFGTHAASLGKTLAGCQERDGVEVIEKKQEGSYCRLILQDGYLLGAQAVGRLADNLGLLLGAMWRRDNLHHLKAKWPLIQQLNSPYPWPYRLIGRYLDLW
ncbi:MAG: hypothetical protein PWQ18_1252 [Clostridia bacterium]|nr:hypothetical protein [Clostridia bacterium]